MTRKSDPRIALATKRARIFLKAPHQSMHDRIDSLEGGAVLVRQVVELAVKAGRDDIAFRALALAQDMERRQ